MSNGLTTEWRVIVRFSLFISGRKADSYISPMNIMTVEILE